MSSQQHGPEYSSERPRDPDDLRQRHRLEAIKTTREHAKETMRDARHLYHMGEITRHSYQTLARGAVEEYIIELETLIRKLQQDDDHELTESYWTGVNLGQQSLPNGQAWQFTGLRSIVTAPDPIVVSWTEQTDTIVGGSDMTEQSETVQIELAVLKTAYRKCNQFLMDADLDFQFESAGMDEWGFDEIDEKGIDNAS
jgi:hypothetical protein